MLIKWLEPIIETRGNNINDDVLGQENQEYEKFLSILKFCALSNEVKFELENAFILNTRKAVQVAYKSGLKDGISIYRDQANSSTLL